MILHPAAAVRSCAAAMRRSGIWGKPIRVSATITYHRDHTVISRFGSERGVYDIIRSRNTLLATGQAFTRGDALARDRELDATLTSLQTY
jgi:hypothetical protein